MIWSPLRRRAVLRRFALRTARRDVVRRGWLAAILLLFLARSLPLGKQRKCFGGLSICSFGFPGPVVLPATPYSQPPLPLPSIRARRRLSKCADTLRLTLALAGKESEGVGAVIKAGPIGEGWRGAAWGVGAHPDAGGQILGSRLETALGLASPLFFFGSHRVCVGGKSRPPGRGAGNRSQTRPMWSAAGVPDSPVSLFYPVPSSGPAGGLLARVAG